MTDQRSITLDGLVKPAVIECRIDADGDLLVEHDKSEMFVYIPKDQVPMLRDWLNKVLP